MEEENVSNLGMRKRDARDKGKKQFHQKLVIAMALGKWNRVCINGGEVGCLF